MNRGYIRLWRKITECDALKERGKVFSKFEAWIHITMTMAQGVDNGDVKRGEFRASYRYLGKAWLWDVHKVYRFIKSLEAENMLSRKTISAQHPAQHLAQQEAQHFIVCNYETYNPSSNADDNTQRNTSRNKLKEGFKEGIKEGEKNSLPPSVLFEIYESENRLLPQVKARSQDRMAKCRSRINQAVRSGCLDKYLEDFREAVAKAQLTPFLCGENDRGWKADFDWFTANQTNPYKVLEGKYDSNGRNQQKDLLL